MFLCGLVSQRYSQTHSAANITEKYNTGRKKNLYRHVSYMVTNLQKPKISGVFCPACKILNYSLISPSWRCSFVLALRKEYPPKQRWHQIQIMFEHFCENPPAVTRYWRKTNQFFTVDVQFHPSCKLWNLVWWATDFIVNADGKFESCLPLQLIFLNLPQWPWLQSKVMAFSQLRLRNLY